MGGGTDGRQSGGGGVQGVMVCVGSEGVGQASWADRSQTIAPSENAVGVVAVGTVDVGNKNG